VVTLVSYGPHVTPLFAPAVALFRRLGNAGAVRNVARMVADRERDERLVDALARRVAPAATEAPAAA
jgi:hypothetical protein